MSRRRSEWAREHQAIFEAGLRDGLGDEEIAVALRRAGAAASRCTVARRRREAGVARQRGRRRVERAACVCPTCGTMRGR